MPSHKYNARILSKLAQFALAASLLSSPLPVYAQSQGACRSTFQSSSRSDLEVSISEVTFSGFIQLPIAEQDEIAELVKQQTHGSSADNVLQEALEKIRAGWQDRGYFKVEVSGEERPASKSANHSLIVLFVHIDENAQYRLGGIALRNNRALVNSAKLREVFQIKDGDIFSREKIAQGLNDLRRLYGEYGYANYTGVPATSFDERTKLAYLTIDIDEGKQFYVSEIRLEGLNGDARQRAVKELALNPGGVYNTRLWELSLPRIASLFPACDCKGAGQLHLDEKSSTVAISLDLSACIEK